MKASRPQEIGTSNIGVHRSFKAAVFLAAGLGLVAVGGCETSSISAEDVNDLSVQTAREVEVSLSEAANRSANALETLAGIERARTAPLPSSVDETKLPGELRTKTTIDWSGPVEGLVKELATQAGYEFTVQGPAPKTPPMINISAKEKAVVKVLEDVGNQVWPAATLIVNPNIARVELRYGDFDRSSVSMSQ